MKSMLGTNDVAWVRYQVIEKISEEKTCFNLRVTYFYNAQQT